VQWLQWLAPDAQKIRTLHSQPPGDTTGQTLSDLMLQPERNVSVSAGYAIDADLYEYAMSTTGTISRDFQLADVAARAAAVSGGGRARGGEDASLGSTATCNEPFTEIDALLRLNNGTMTKCPAAPGEPSFFDLLRGMCAAYWARPTLGPRPVALACGPPRLRALLRRPEGARPLGLHAPPPEPASNAPTEAFPRSRPGSIGCGPRSRSEVCRFSAPAAVKACGTLSERCVPACGRPGWPTAR
jgi:hypothetical protein